MLFQILDRDWRVRVWWQVTVRYNGVDQSLRVPSSPSYYMPAYSVFLNTVFFNTTFMWIWTFTGGTCSLDNKIKTVFTCFCFWNCKNFWSKVFAMFYVRTCKTLSYELSTIIFLIKVIRYWRDRWTWCSIPISHFMCRYDWNGNIA